MSFDWSEPYPELHKLCIVFERHDLLSPIRWSYNPLPNYLQNGPQCGLVALAMLTKNCNVETVNKIYEFAKEMGFTYNGEIFSAKNMCSLAEKFLPEATVQLYSGSLNDDRIREFLLKGGHMLVPHDINKDNTPGLHQGHKAHWCVISGAIETEEDFFVLARHGKMRNVAIWKLEDLAASNQQLLEFSPDRKLEEVEYKLPPGGIDGSSGLNFKSILINLDS